MHNFNLSFDLNDGVAAREEIWNKYDRLLEEAKQIDRFSYFNNYFLDRGQLSLAKEKLSPEELLVIIPELKREEQIIIQSEKNIVCYEQEIASIKQKQYYAFGGAGITAAIALFVLL